MFLFSSSSYLDVSVQRVSLHMAMYLPCSDTGYCLTGFPPFGYLRVYGYLLLTAAFAACHVLLRLLMPSHSPYALYSLTNLVWFLNYIRIRDLFLKLKFLPIILSYIEKTFFHISLITNLVIGV